MNNWPINTSEDGLPCTVTQASQAVTIAPAGDTTKLMATDVMIDNPGPNDVFVRAGSQFVLASLRSLRIPAGSLQPFGKGQTTHLALICRPGQTQDVTIHVGAGQ